MRKNQFLVKFLFSLLLIFSTGSIHTIFGQVYYRNTFSSFQNDSQQDRFLEELERTGKALQARHDQLSANINALQQAVADILTKDIDADMRAKMNNFYKEIRALKDKVNNEIDWRPCEKEFDNLYNRISDEIVAYNNRIAEQKTSNNQNSSSNMYSTPDKPTEWSGTGFALLNGYIATNYHVVDGAKKIVVKGVNGDFYTGLSANVIASDKYNDIAILKINDTRFRGFGTIPYPIETSLAYVGEEIFVLGYPLRTSMGDEIKYTTGVISSRTGFQGDVALYQISAPVQPGNSGGPLFNSKGEIIGIVSAKHTGAENVGYAIKACYLKILSETYISSDILPTGNSITNLSRPDQIKAVSKFIFLIECTDKP